MYDFNPMIQKSLHDASKRGKGANPAGADGLEVEIQSDGEYVQWRYKGFAKWNNLIAIENLKGETGKPGPKGEQGVKGDMGIMGVEGNKGDTGPRGLPGEMGTAGLDGLDGKDGVDGREVELRKTDTHIQWRYVGEELWKDLIRLDELRGAKGNPGPQGEQGEKGERGIPGIAGSRGPRGVIGYTGPAGPQGIPGDGSNLFIQQVAPVTTEPVYQWWETDGSGNLVTLWVETNGA